MKRVMLIDDAPEVRSSTVGLIRAYCDDVKLFIGRDLYDADGYVYDDGIPFDLMVIDLSLGDYEFDDPAEQRKIEELGRDGRYLVGWFWIKRFLRQHPEFSPKKIVVLSAYTDLLKNWEIEKTGVQVISKQDRDSAKLLLDKIANC